MSSHFCASPFSVCYSLDPLHSAFSDGLTASLSSYIVQKLHRDLPLTTLYAYGTSKETATSPGPTLIAQKNQKTVIRWTNNIDDSSLCDSEELCLPVDKTLDLANPDKGVPNGVLSHPAPLYSCLYHFDLNV